MTPIEQTNRCIIGYDHDIWEHVVPGDCIEVAVMSSNLMSPTDDCEAAILVHRVWEPSAAMLELL